MSGFRKGMTAALGLAETASISDITTAWTRMLAEEMTPEEIEQKKKDDEAAAAAAEKEKGGGDSEMAESVTALRGVFKLDDKAGLKDIVAAALKGVAAPATSGTETALALEVRSLSERLTIAEAGAKKAEQLERDAKTSARDRFLSEQMRAGKMLPTEKDFFIASWDKDEAAVRKYFETKKPVVKLSERGLDLPGEAVEDKDPRVEMAELATKRAGEKGIDFKEAMEQIKKEQPELTERVASMYGPAGLARR